MPIFNFFSGKVHFYSVILVPNYYVKIGSYNTIKKKNSAFWMLLPQIGPDVIREFSFSWDVVLRTLTCLKRSPFPINEIMHVEKVSKVQRAATIISLPSKKPNRHLKRGQTKLLIPIALPELLFLQFSHFSSWYLHPSRCSDQKSSSSCWFL